MNRNLNFDLMRIFACFLVIVVHVSGQNWYFLNASSFEWITMNTYDSFAHISVPLFFMLSGVFFLNKKEISFKNLFTKNILKLLIIFFIWSAFYTIDRLDILSTHRLNASEIIANIIMGEGHMWYIKDLLGIYIMYPIIYAFVHYEDGKYIKYYLAIFFIFEILKCFVSGISGVFFTSSTLGSFFNLISPNFLSYTGYVVLGYFLTKNNLSIKPFLSIALIILLTAISSFLNTVISIYQGSPSEIFFGYFQITIFIEAILTFNLFYNQGVALGLEKYRKCITTLSSCTFGIYLVHIFVLNKLGMYFGLNTLSFIPMLSVPLISLLVFVISLVITYIIHKIPFVNRIV